METASLISIGRLPRVEFGDGRLALLPELLEKYGPRFLLVTGARSFMDSRHWNPLAATLKRRGLVWEHVPVAGEPSPQLVDDAVASLRGRKLHAVVGIGGGSALDAAKAIAGLLIPGNSVLDHLEGIGPELPYQGPATPFIAVPTTAGTGSEATRNAVLSTAGVNGYKKSFRDEALVAQYALIDPSLLADCPPAVLASNGMDALTQLLESYVSLKSNPFMDALAVDGLAACRKSLLPWYEGRGDPAQHRRGMAYAAMLSGITLAHVGLGAVHGLAAPLGAFFPIPHGVACGTLVAATTRMNVDCLRECLPESPALRKYAEAGRVLSGRDLPDPAAIACLLEILEDWTQRLGLERLGKYGVRREDIPRIVANSRGNSMKTNPVLLGDAEIAAIVEARL